MAEHGGRRTPQNPAPASGPGRLARRTDGGPGQKVMVPDGMPYGDRAELAAQEATVAMSQADSVAPAQVAPAAAAAAQPPQMAVPFGAPSQRPNEPVTHGVDIGAGGGQEALPPQAQPQMTAIGPVTRMLAQMGPLTGELAALYQAASTQGV